MPSPSRCQLYLPPKLGQSKMPPDIAKCPPEGQNHLLLESLPYNLISPNTYTGMRAHTHTHTHTLLPSYWAPCYFPNILWALRHHFNCLECPFLDALCCTEEINTTCGIFLGSEDPWRREWQPTPVFLPGEFHGQRSLVGYSLWGHRESDTTEWWTLSLSVTACTIQIYTYSEHIYIYRGPWDLFQV